MLIWRKKSCFPEVFFVFEGYEYRWCGWLGSQLISWEWKRAPAGTTRRLETDMGRGIDITVATTRRVGWFKVETTWAVSNSGTHDEHVARIEHLRDSLRKLI